MNPYDADKKDDDIMNIIKDDDIINIIKADIS